MDIPRIIYDYHAGFQEGFDMEQPEQKISLNVHLQVPPPPTTSIGQDGSHTPNTPEIVNSIVNMTSGPFGGFPQQQTTMVTSRPASTLELPSMMQLESYPSLAQVIDQLQ